jgi:hypothetical protein
MKTPLLSFANSRRSKLSGFRNEQPQDLVAGLHPEHKE